MRRSICFEVGRHARTIPSGHIVTEWGTGFCDTKTRFLSPDEQRPKRINTMVRRRR